MLFNLLCVLIVIIVLGALAVMYVLHKMGTEHVYADTKHRTEFAVDEITDNSITVNTVIDLVNDGKSSAAILDCFVRPQLPYEQYDGIAVTAHAELVDVHREDDYFEAWLLDKQNRIHIKCQLKLTARKGMDIRTAIAGMPDFNFQLFWQCVGRKVAQYHYDRVTVPATKIAVLADIKRAKD